MPKTPDEIRKEAEEALKASNLYQQSLEGTTDAFKKINEQQKKSSKEMDNIVSLSTQLNNLMKEKRV